MHNCRSLRAAQSSHYYYASNTHTHTMHIYSCSYIHSGAYLSHGVSILHLLSVALEQVALHHV